MRLCFFLNYDNFAPSRLSSPANLDRLDFTVPIIQLSTKVYPRASLLYNTSLQRLISRRFRLPLLRRGRLLPLQPELGSAHAPAPTEILSELQQRLARRLVAHHRTQHRLPSQVRPRRLGLGEVGEPTGCRREAITARRCPVPLIPVPSGTHRRRERIKPLLVGEVSDDFLVVA